MPELADLVVALPEPYKNHLQPSLIAVVRQAHGMTHWLD